jgi:hypothetical protein
MTGTKAIRSSRADDRLVHHDADVIRVPFGRNQQALFKEAQGLSRRGQGSVAANSFTLLGPDHLERRMKPIADPVVRKLGHGAA